MLGTTGEVVLILDALNAVNIRMDAKEAARLSRDPRVLRVTQSVMPTPYTVQDATYNWGLDRLDSATPDRNNAYSYTNTGAGRTIWILDSGLALSNANVAAEFGGRASIFYDWFNTVPYGNDCDTQSHGTMVASVAGGNTIGIGKGAALNIVKVTNWGRGTCGTDPGIDTFLGSLNWLATPGNAPRGSIVNISFGFSNSSCTPVPIPPDTGDPYDNAIIAMHNNAGLIVVVAAGNNGCNVADFPMTRKPEAFVVGGTSSDALYLSSGRYDALYSDANGRTNTGANVSTFAPAENVRAMDKNGFTPSLGGGTSLAAPYIAGVFAVVCQAAGTHCDTTPIATLYNELRGTGTLGTVKNADGSTPLPNGSTSRFIWQQW
ncbi:MAG: S8 family serine peptidase [Burkholderiales bacterium]